MRKVSIIVLTTIVLIGLADRVSATLVYDRTAAYNYSQKYWDKVVSDGYFWDNSSAPTAYPAGQALTPTQLGDSGFDCAHFVSSSIGNESHEAGGGLDVPPRPGANFPSYGKPGANELIIWLLDGHATTDTTKTTPIGYLEMGDVIGYDWNSDAWIDHVALYLGGGKVATHSSSHQSADWNLGNTSYTFVHIPEPATLGLLGLGGLLFFRRRRT